MTRRRFRQDPETFALIEITEDDYKPSNKGDAALWGDRGYDGMSTTDGQDISSRTKHREYMKQTGLVTFDDYKDTFRKAESQRESYFTGQSGSISRRDIERSIEQLKRG